jgi:hypothetical protein
LVVFLGCSERSLVGKNNLNISDSSYNASSYFDNRYAPYEARLNGPYGWAPRDKYLADPDQYLQIDLGTQRVITAVATQGSGDKNEFVTKYKLNFTSDDISKWTSSKDTNGKQVRTTYLKCS